MLADLMSAAFDRLPTDARGAVTFTDATGRTTRGEAVGAAARASRADSFKDAAAIRNRNRELTVRAVGLAFAPTAGMTAQWEGGAWNVLAATPIAPNGGAVFGYTVILNR